MTDAAVRRAELKQMLLKHQRELQDEVQNRIRDGRADRSGEVGDSLEHSDADIQGEIEFALLQMRTETLSRIDNAVARLETGDYGRCFDCGEEISEKRLRALPFAARCQSCEERREQEQGQAKQAQRRSSLQQPA